MALPFLLLLLLWARALAPALAGDPFAYYDWEVSYVSAQPLAVKQKVSILVYPHIIRQSCLFVFSPLPLIGMGMASHRIHGGMRLRRRRRRTTRHQ